MAGPAGITALGLSACGYPLMQFAVRRWGARGAAVAEAVCARLAIGDASLAASGVPGRLRTVPAALLQLELAAGPQSVGMDLHRRRSVLVRVTPEGRRLGTARFSNSPVELQREMAKAGTSPEVAGLPALRWAVAGAIQRQPVASPVRDVPTGLVG